MVLFSFFTQYPIRIFSDSRFLLSLRDAIHEIRDTKREEVRYVYIFIVQLAPQGAINIYKRAKKDNLVKIKFLNLKGE